VSECYDTGLERAEKEIYQLLAENTAYSLERDIRKMTEKRNAALLVEIGTIRLATLQEVKRMLNDTPTMLFATALNKMIEECK